MCYRYDSQRLCHRQGSQLPINFDYEYTLLDRCSSQHYAAPVIPFDGARARCTGQFLVEPLVRESGRGL
jgi:hypothetical protein